MFFKKKGRPADQEQPKEPATDGRLPESPPLLKSLEAAQKTTREAPPVDHAAELKPMVRISRAAYDPTARMLEVNGWCLSMAPAFELFLEVRGTRIVAPVKPNDEPREDVFQHHRQYNNKNSGWRVRLPVGELPEGASARILYLAGAQTVSFDTPIKAVETPAVAVKPALGDEVLVLSKCSFSPLRSLFTVNGSITSSRDDLRLVFRLASGADIREPHVRFSAPNENGRRSWKANFVASGLHDGDTLIVAEADNPRLEKQIAVELLNDSPRRQTAMTPSVQPSTLAVPGMITLTEMVDFGLRMAGRRKSAKDAQSVCYFPAFDDVATLSEHYHRASWYLTGDGSPVTRITLAGPATRETVLPPPAYFGRARLDDATLEIVEPGEAWLDALMRAGTIMVWRPIPEALSRQLSRLLGGKVKIVTVATDDPVAVEYGNYCRVPWMLLPEDRRTELLNESQQRLRAVFARQREAGKTCSAVFGTGPSIDRAFDFDFGQCMSVACNSIVANDALLDHIAPAFVCAGDAVSHFGVSLYAETFRADLVRALTTRDIHFFTSAAIGFLLVQKHPEIRDRVILCEQRFNGLNADLENVWSLPRFDSTLNIHMLPIAASFSDTVYMLGLDGRNPDPTQNEDFWAHSSAAQYHDLVETGHQAHPTFAINRQQATEERYLASVRESLMAGEVIGKTFHALADSFTPPVHARPALAPCFEPAGDTVRRKPRALPRPVPEPGTRSRRALVVSQINRRHFSGGRYHGSMLAEALATFCDEVVVWANNMPPWSGDMGYLAAHSRIRFWVNDMLAPPPGMFDHVVVLPDGSQDPSLYHAAIETAKASNAHLILVNFESPNWFNALSPAPRDLARSDIWYATSCFSDIVLSSAETAVPFARSFYRTLFHTPAFAVAPPAINDTIADEVRARQLPRERQIILISRFGNENAHKNIDAIFDLITPVMQGYTLALIAGTSDLPDEATLAAFRVRLAAAGLGLKLLHMVSDREKFEEIARSELMIFPSLFEGFGYPPVEAGYMGTPCVVFDLPVLQEFSHDHAHFVPWGDVAAMRSKIEDLLRLPPAERLRTHEPAVRQTATLSHFARTLHDILASAPPASAASAFTVEKFAAVRKVYADGLYEPPLAFSAFNRRELQDIVERYAGYNRVIEGALERVVALSPANRGRGVS